MEPVRTLASTDYHAAFLGFVRIDLYDLASVHIPFATPNPFFEAAIADLKGQIQKVSAQLAASKPAPQMVNNP